MIDFETNNMHYFSMHQLKKLYEDNEITPLEITNYMFERINKYDSELKSFANYKLYV